MNLSNLKRLFLKALIGCLVASAALAVVTVLIGHFNTVTERALFTILLIALHCLVSFGFIVSNEKQETFESLSIFTNAAFIVIVLSFITSVLGVWGIIPGGVVEKLYAFYLVLLFAILHGEVLAKTMRKQKNIDNIVLANFVFMFIVVLLLMPVIFMPDNSLLPSLYYRVLAACGIVDATLTLVAVILHKLYIQKHPQIQDNIYSSPVYTEVPGQPGTFVPATAQTPKKRRMNIFVILLVAYVGIQLAIGLVILVAGVIFRQ